MDKETKLKALLATAQAFADRGEWLQYDQYCLDRVDTVSPRRQDFAPPEAATSHRRLFLDCSGFVWATYFQTFDYMLEADLTWHIIDHVTPRVYYKEFTHEETPEEIDNIRNELLALLQPGDVITYSYNGNGHTLIYVDKDTYINCSGCGTYNGYHYKENRNIFSEHGGIYVEDSKDLLWMCDDPIRNRCCLFKGDRTRFAIHRPLDLVGDPTPDAMARIGKAAGLIVSVLSNYPGGRTAEPGAELDYTVVVRNKNDKAVDLDVSFEAGFGSTGSAKEYAAGSVEAGAEKTFTFRAEAGNRDVVEAPTVYVNGLHIDAPMILVGHNLCKDDADKVIGSVKNSLAAGTEIQAAVSSAYAQLGIHVYPLARQSMRRLYFLHDSVSGDVLSRRAQIPSKDMNVKTYYGGRGVVTPQVCSMFGVRTVNISADDLQPGDIICYADGANFENASEALWTGSGFLGIEGDTETFIQSLFGRFVFAVLRPSLTIKE